MSIFKKTSTRFRATRMRGFAHTFGSTAHTTVPDIGGTPYNRMPASVRPRVALLNVPRAAEAAHERLTWVTGIEGERKRFYIEHYLNGMTKSPVALSYGPEASASPTGVNP